MMEMEPKLRRAILSRDNEKIRCAALLSSTTRECEAKGNFVRNFVGDSKSHQLFFTRQSYSLCRFIVVGAKVLPVRASEVSLKHKHSI